MNTMSWFRQCKVSRNDVVRVKQDWLKLLLTPLLLLVFLCVPASNAPADFPDISFSVSASSSTVQPGETYQVTVNYTNNTGATIQDVVISTDYPAGLSYSYTPAGGVKPDPGTDDHWTIGTVADATGGSRSAFVTVADDVAPGTQFENVFSFSYAVGTTTPAPIREGDLVTVREAVLQVWNFNPLGADPGCQAMYRIVYRNYSDVTAENVVFTYTYPTGFTYSSANVLPDDTADDPADPDVWTRGNIGPNTYNYIYVWLNVDPDISWPVTCTSELKVDYDCTIDKTNEQNTRTDATHVTVQHTPVASVTGVYLASDPEHAGTNYYTGGSFDADTGVITLGTGLGTNTDVLVSYQYTKSYTETLTDSTRVVDGYQVLMTDEHASGDDIGEQPWSPDSEWIVFMSDFSGNNDIYKIRRSGKNLTQLTTYPECDSMPAWSPAGDKIAHSRDNSGTMPDPYDTNDGSNADIYVMDTDGSNSTQLTTKGDCQHWVVWSPDGAKIAYKDDMGTEDHWYPSLWVMDADGSNQMPLFVPEYAGAGGKPWQFWSPDSEWIGFPSTANNNDWYTDLYKIKADGTELTKLTWTPDMCEQFCGFSADGETILYWTEDQAILYTMGKDGLWGRPILHSEDMFNWIHGQKAKWTPPCEPNNKNRWIVVPIEQDGTWDNQIWLVSWDGTYLKQLTSELDYLSPVMSPDCSAIVAVDQDNRDLYVINLGLTDTDNEGLKDWEELITGTDPAEADTDGGGVNDATEVDMGTNPLDPADDALARGEPAADVNEDDDDFCFIATAAFGSPLAEEVVVLSKFRDRYLVTNALGRSFVSAYYRFGPDAAEFIKDRPVLKTVVRGGLRVLVAAVKPLVD